MYTFKIYKSDRFISVKLKDSSLDDIFKVFKEIRQHADFDHGYDGIVDIRKSKLSLEVKDLQSVADFIHESPWVKGKWVLLNDSPSSTIMSMLYKELTHTFHSIDVCSSIEKANELLDCDVLNYIME